ncbi:DUF3800 domain-containing protein [Elizabethkingia anophelis]|jgi:hypothetical protein|uniref:DUF3800 domain-containing protein n=1 Tax=Elizabethkingia anophelis TaxID=1117645 RepID=UPI0021A92F59|nr:DUF3800 domain-containing protein [Elizabethkingia anophelis]MCT3630141.1 DUF3800 domain-containing protein [Elizabethkingia anophelis]MCT3633655.1 DUF3800 domain-containing protein [Elizabethkingia anophelis]MCT3830412.1 DUF3800 domain-containing protein [Elizabethkingia anophelis]MCT3883859.1 DUF3800 domain-containing protein [Elizabethkingia anophelis]MCT3894627.1 DUF3800 domain-containing protein [Elizabethkingia anophelis]
MKPTINIYCDESCHLQNDKEPVMVIGAVYCPIEKKEEIFERLYSFKVKHNLIPKNKKNDKDNRPYYELKWNKVSKSKIEYYKDVINYFFDDDDLQFRVLVVSNKSAIDYEKFNHTHDTFYYKMYFGMLKAILNPENSHHIYIDIKDTKSKEKVHKLEQVLRNDKYDYSKEIIKKVQQVRSHEVEILQLADLLVGATAYVNRGLANSKAKNELIQLIKHRSKYSLTKSTLLKERKFNVFIWEPQKPYFV